MMKFLITGGAGFIGSEIVRQFLVDANNTIINVDKLTYAGNLESLAEVRNNPRHIFECIDICDRTALDRVFRQHRPDTVIHLAAESHVDRSIIGSAAFVETNIVGTYTLLEAARAYWSELAPKARADFRFHHVSTDEVYGDLQIGEAAFTEETPYAPSSPYSATKACSDHLVRAWHRTYGLPVLISNCSNNYGPYQFPEKLIPLMILNALRAKELPLYGQGENIRDWLFVEDHARALRLILAEGEVGRTYNIGGQSERTNLDVVQEICRCLDRHVPSNSGPYENLIRFVADRPGHDLRYAIDNGRLTRELGWLPLETFESGIEKTVRWYLNNTEWLNHVESDRSSTKLRAQRNSQRGVTS